MWPELLFRDTLWGCVPGGGERHAGGSGGTLTQSVSLGQWLPSSGSRFRHPSCRIHFHGAGVILSSFPGSRD